MGAVTALRGADSVVGLLDSPAGAYVHVPFCERICPFCPYNKVRARDDLAAGYFAALHQEFDSLESAHRHRFTTSFTSLYVGGGTPTLYPDQLAALLARLPSGGERAVEVLPGHGTPERLQQLADMGFTAVSIGAQSFDDAVLRHLVRPHDGDTARAAMEAAVGRFECVDVDLIVDVALEASGSSPAIAPGTFLSAVETCFDAGVDQVSTYPLMRFGYTPFGRTRHQRAREHAVLAEVSELARAMGYERRSVWTFNRRGARTYSSITRRRFVGMGAGASSSTGRDFLVNHFGIRSYTDAIGGGNLPIARRLHLGRWAGAAYDSFWQAYAGAVDPATLAAAYGGSVSTAVRLTLSPLAWMGLLTRESGVLELTPRGFDVYHDLERLVTYQFIEPLWGEMLREHGLEGADLASDCTLTDPPRGGRGSQWAHPEKARSGRLWRVARHLMERDVDTLVGADPG